MVPNGFFDHLQPFLVKPFFDQLQEKKVLLYWLQVRLQPDSKNLGSGIPNLMAADKPCPQLLASLKPNHYHANMNVSFFDGFITIIAYSCNCAFCISF